MAVSVSSRTVIGMCTDDQAHFEIQLNKIPDYQIHENSWWLAKIFPLNPKRKWVRVSAEARNFSQLANTVKQYLGWSEDWNSLSNYAAEQLLFDRQERTLKDNELNRQASGKTTIGIWFII